MEEQTRPDVERLERERTFFDEWAARSAGDVGPIDPLAVERYSAPNLRKRFDKEFRFRLLGDLSGMSVLDVGCGEGGNSVLLAKLGAHATGIDVSPGAIALAKERAAASGVSDRTTFHCSPIEEFDAEHEPFDVIWCDSILHHLIPVLDPVMRKLVQLSAPHTRFILKEPVNLNHTLRRIRKCVPVHTEATPDERPLERPELDLLREHLPDMSIRHFSLFLRLNRFILVSHNYERSSWLRRGISNAIAAIDWPILSLPWFRNLAGEAVMYGHPRTE